MKKSIIYTSIFNVLLILYSCNSTKITEIKNKQKNFSIMFLGDILLADKAEKYIDEIDINYPFEKIKDDLLNYDIVFANLEAPISNRGKPVEGKPYTFAIDPEIALCLSRIKLDVVSIANNHILDYGLEGMEDTIMYINKWHILHTGAGDDIKEARRPSIFKIANTEIFIFAYCERPPAHYYATEDKSGTAPLNIDYIKEDIKKYKTETNVILISLHWGIEHTHVPQGYQIRMAHEIIEAGADGIIGHHPHWPQGIEVYKNKPVIYSLGNFINGHYNIIESDNIITAFYYYMNNLEKIEIYSVAGHNKRIHVQPYIIKDKTAKENLIQIKNLSHQFKTEIKIDEYRGIIEFNKSPSFYK